MPRKIAAQTGATAIILLVVGASTRLGRAKQLVPWNGEPLLRHSAIVALSARLGPVIVVLGAVERVCRKLLAALSLEIAVNSAWTQGMGGLIAAGMIAVQNSVSPLESVIIMLCYQPYVSSAILRSRDYIKAEQSNEEWEKVINKQAHYRYAIDASNF